jgi:hypothetical protein
MSFSLFLSGSKLAVGTWEMSISLGNTAAIWNSVKSDHCQDLWVIDCQFASSSV